MSDDHMSLEEFDKMLDDNPDIAAVGTDIIYELAQSIWEARERAIRRALLMTNEDAPALVEWDSLGTEARAAVLAATSLLNEYLSAFGM